MDYQPSEIAKELIALMGTISLRNILQSIRDNKWFSLTADETRDITNGEQLSVSIRWVDSNYAVHEDFIGCVLV